MSTFMVSGGSGFIGRAVVQALAATPGCRILTVSRQTLHEASPDVRKVDLLDHSAVSDLMTTERPSHLVHLAWDVSHGDYWNADSNAIWSDATIHLANEFAAHGGRRLVVAGTCAERAPQLSGTRYAQAKSRTREVLSQIAGLEVTWLRVFFPIGPYEEPRRFVPSLIRSLAANERFLVREPSLVRDLCSVFDVGRAFAAAATGTSCGTYEVGAGTGMSLHEAASTLANLMEREHLLDFGPKSSSDPLVAAVGDFSDHFGWDAMISPHDALAQAVDWWKDRT